jgi:hypothetical protein
MDKGIRPFAISKFIALAPARVNDRAGNTAFRKSLIATLMEEFGITLASAATHYNHAFIEAKKTHPALCEGLGRAEDKKGGRKAKSTVEATTADTALTVGEVLESNLHSTEEIAEEAAPVAPAAPVQKYSVCKSSDKTVVCGDLTMEEAVALIDKAAKAKKAKLELVA